MAKLIDTKGLEVFKGLIEDQIPENLSELSNDSGFITADDIPTKLSELENDVNLPTTAEITAMIAAAMPISITNDEIDDICVRA